MSISPIINAVSISIKTAVNVIVTLSRWVWSSTGVDEYVEIEAAEITDDFEIHFTFARPPKHSNAYVLSSDGNNVFRLVTLLYSDTIEFVTNSTYPNIKGALTGIAEGEEVRLSAYGENGTASIYINERFRGTVKYMLPFYIDRVFSSPCSGEFKNLTISSGVALNRIYRFDETPGTNVVVNSAEDAQCELISHAVVNDSIIYNDTLPVLVGARRTDWIAIDGGSRYLVEVIGGEASRSRWQYSIDNGVTFLYGGNNFEGGALDRSPDVFFDVPLTATHVRVYFSNASDSATDLSLKKIIGFGRRVNFGLNQAVMKTVKCQER